MVQVRDNNFASVTSDHKLKQFLVVRNFNPRTSRVSLWFSVACCFAADSSCVTHSRNRFCVLADLWLRFELRVTQSHNLFCVFAFLVVRDLRLRFELRNSQPQFVFRFCDFLDVNQQDLLH